MGTGLCDSSKTDADSGSIFPDQKRGWITVALGGRKMYVPSLLDRVRVNGGEHVFLVVNVDEAQGCVDLVSWNDEYGVVERFPLVQHFPFSIVQLLAPGAFRPKG